MAHRNDQTKLNASSGKQNVKEKGPKGTGKTTSHVDIVEKELQNEERTGINSKDGQHR